MKKTLTLAYRLLGPNGAETDFIPVAELPATIEHLVRGTFTLEAVEISIVAVNSHPPELVVPGDRVNINLSVSAGFRAATTVI